MVGISTRSWGFIILAFAIVLAFVNLKSGYRVELFQYMFLGCGLFGFYLAMKEWWNLP